MKDAIDQFPLIKRSILVSQIFNLPITLLITWVLRVFNTETESKRKTTIVLYAISYLESNKIIHANW